MATAQATHHVPRGVERYGVEPIPAELRTVGWRDIFSMIFTFNLSPFVYLVGAIAVTAGGLPVWWAAGSLALGGLLGSIGMALAAQAGVDYGLPGQVAMRASFGQWGARGLTSPYRVIASTYWFAAQALVGALGFQAILLAVTGRELPLVPIALVLAGLQAFLAVIGFNAMRYSVRAVMPLAVLVTGAFAALFLRADDPAYQVSHVLRSPELAFTWVGFATFVTVQWGAQLTNVANTADFCRYARSRRHVWIGIVGGSVAGQFIAGWVGAYAAAASGETNPFIAVTELTNSTPLLVAIMLAVAAQTTSANIMNTYTAGLSLVNLAPRLGRFWTTVLVGAIAVALSAFPDFINEAQKWMTHLGNVAAPLGGVIVADYVILKRTHIDVLALFDPNGRYRFPFGLNPAGIAAVAIAAGVYYMVPDGWLKAAWGFGVGAGSYLALALLQAALFPRLRLAIQPAESEIAEVAEAVVGSRDGRATLLEPGELRRLPLSRRLRGYDRGAVERLRETAATSYGEVWRERDELSERLARLERELADYRELERLLRDSLLSAQRTAQELAERTRQESEHVLAQAQQRAGELVAAAQADRDRLREEVRRLDRLGREIEGDYRALLTKAAELLDGTPRGAAQERATSRGPACGEESP